MSKVPLCEVYNTKLKLNEDAKKPEYGVLATVSGVFAEYDKKNRNGRMYSEEVWDRTLANESVQSALAGKRMYGELDHPEDYLDIKIDKTAFCVTSLKKDPSRKVILGEMKILDTPAGNILNTLVRFGSVLGVSSRASGELTEDGTVIPDMYEFVTFDVVTNPSNVGALPELEESVDQSKLAAALCESTTTADKDGLQIIKDIAESMDSDFNNELIYKIDKREETLDSDTDRPGIEERLDAIEGKIDYLVSLVENHFGPLPEPEPEKTEVAGRVEEKVKTRALRKKSLTEGVRKETKISVTRAVDVEEDRSVKIIESARSR